MLKIHNHLLGP